MTNPVESKMQFGVRGAMANARREQFAQLLAMRVPRLQAMQEAGYRKPTEPNARRLANEPAVNARVSELMLAEAKTVGAHTGAILLEMCRLGFANLHPLMMVGEDGQTRPQLDVSRPITKELAAAVQEMSFDAKGRPKIKLHDKAAVLRDLAKIYELYTDAASNETNVNIAIGLGERLDRALQRAG